MDTAKLIDTLNDIVADLAIEVSEILPLERFLLVLCGILIESRSDTLSADGGSNLRQAIDKLAPVDYSVLNFCLEETIAGTTHALPIRIAGSSYRYHPSTLCLEWTDERGDTERSYLPFFGVSAPESRQAEVEEIIFEAGLEADFPISNVEFGAYACEITYQAYCSFTGLSKDAMLRVPSDFMAALPFRYVRDILRDAFQKDRAGLFLRRANESLSRSIRLALEARLRLLDARDIVIEDAVGYIAQKDGAAFTARFGYRGSDQRWMRGELSATLANFEFALDEYVCRVKADQREVQAGILVDAMLIGSVLNILRGRTLEFVEMVLCNPGRTYILHHEDAIVTGTLVGRRFIGRVETAGTGRNYTHAVDLLDDLMPKLRSLQC